MSSTGSPPFTFSHVIVTPQSKSTSTHKLHKIHNAGNVDMMTASLTSGGSSTSAISPTLSMPSPQDIRGACPCPHAILLSQVATNAP